ncbi:MAG: TAT-variant-translocated molybdopterin oxidoreductase [Opitutaceae bacterium]|nr:TAT-variant-translocated molybdopterin oxidoreductase [Opitutaceae bacterium]
MKRTFSHPEPSHAEKTGPRYWRSLDELTGNPKFREYLDREFPEGASELNETDRRHFFKIMAASFAFGGLTLTGCRRPEAKILAYAKTPENTIPGLPLYFATAMPIRRDAIPLVVETHSGRPTKIEGNPTFTSYAGATNLVAQASILDLYDPDRSTSHKRGTAAQSLAQIQDLLTSVGARHADGYGAGLAFLAEQSSSPTRQRLVRALKKKFPKAVWAEYEPGDAGYVESAATALAGRAAKVHYRLATAKRILAVDADFIGSESGHIGFAREFAAGRRVTKAGQEMNRLYAVESTLTLTGGMADHRLRLATGQMTAFLAQIAAALGVTGVAQDAAAAPASKEWIEACVADLKSARGESAVIAGSHLPPEAHVLALLINEALGNRGHTTVLLETDAEPAASIGELAAAIRSGSVQTLVVLGGNPAYNAPADLAWAELQAKVPESIRLGYYEDETSAVSSYHLSAAHYLESWGDARTADGTVVPVQPMIQPLFHGLTEIEVLARILGESVTDGYGLVQATIATLTRGDAQKAFEKFLHEGVIVTTAYPEFRGALDDAAARRILEACLPLVVPSRDKLEVRFTLDHKVDDGRFNNNGWLQECPDPITKITWDNAIIVSPRLAAELGIVAPDSTLQIIRKNPNEYTAGREVAKIATVTIGSRTVTGPVHIQPGLANYTIQLPLGYGRSKTGRVGEGMGFDAYAARSSDGVFTAQGATITIDTNAKPHQLANTQEHWSMEGRALVREANVEEYAEHPDFVQQIGMESHTPPVYGDYQGTLQQRVSETPRGNSLYEHPNYDGVHQWGMSIDLTTCTGCNACVVACQSENNIPIVGRDQVRRGREMHWIRIDRYYADDKTVGKAFGGADNAIIPEDPQVVVQPLGCVHCETAPCETVCPVNATVHDEEGLNVMAYNRCVGTRYCANNCPYKVRRFNFFDFNKRQLDQLYLGPLGESGMPELVKMVKNPDVTVRMRGVMEKCTYCVQRIQEAKIAQKVKARDSGDVKIPDGTVKVACQQVCPTQAIVFGDISDANSAVSKAKAIDRDYELLGYLNTRPRTTYLARLRNPNKHMPDYQALPLSRVEYNAKNPHGDHGDGHGAGAHGAEAGHGDTPAADHSTGGHH